MPLRSHRLIRIIALSAEMAIHAGIFTLITVAMFFQKAGAYEALQFSMDIVVMFTVMAFLFCKFKYEDLEPSRAPNVTCFSIILSLSLTGALGLAIRATSRSGFCDEFLTSRPGGCRDAGLAMAMSWTCVLIAIVGIFVSVSEKHPQDLEARKLYSPHRSIRELELAKHYPGRELTNAQPRIHIARPPPAAYTAPRPRMERIGSLVPPRAFPRRSQRFSLYMVPTPPPSKSNELPPLMLHRKINGPVPGQSPRKQSPFMRLEDLPTLQTTPSR